MIDLSKLDTITLARGPHDSPASGLCALEAAAYIAGEPHSDHPQCVAETIGAFLRNWNDSISDAEARDRLLKPLLPLAIGTVTTAADEETRAWLATDWLVRVCAPAWLGLTPTLQPHAAALRALPALTSAEIARGARDVVLAAYTAARSAAYTAAYNAAYNAARSAAYTAAYNAADNATRSAAYNAARSAAESDLAPTVAALQASAQDLVRRMCAVGRATTGGTNADE